MQKVFLVLCGLILFGPTARGQQPGAEYRLKRVIPVEGRQGVAVDADHYYVSGSKALYKYDKAGNLLLKNDRPFEELELPANHIGDIDVWKGELYCGIETFVDGRGENIQVAVYDAGTLAFKRALAWEPASGQVEVSGLAVDRARNRVWMSDWVDSRYVYCYDLETGKYLMKMQCRPMPYWCQGIFIAGDTMLFSADDGDATYRIADNIYAADIGEATCAADEDDPGVKAGRLTLFREMNDFRRAGEIEGLAVDPASGELVVLNNRGVEIVLGMPKGPYREEGYTEEIHELYVYEKIK